jgi:hypothetical protein
MIPATVFRGILQERCGKVTVSHGKASEMRWILLYIFLLESKTRILDEMINLSNQWVQLASEKTRYEYTETHQEIREQMQEIDVRFKKLS